MSTGADATKKPTIVLIHGQWFTPRTWERWIDRFQKAGHSVLAPAWPGLAGETEEIRVSRSGLMGIRFDGVVTHFERIIRNLDTPPILMGHSSGALIVKLLIERGLGAAGVLIDQTRDAKASRPLFAGVEASRSGLGKTFAVNKGVSLSEAARMLKEGAFSLLNPKARSRASFRRRGKAAVLVIDGADRQSTLEQSGWEEVADFALQWALENSRDRMTADEVKAAFAPPVLTESREHQVQM